ncbi:hypothetical protein ABT084_15420 [Streptomyces sp. NPDC002138]|uniref:hypothetical protein n=1 Tax=Streptomyces sp. NPDC002138 TaxID=3154410 RepID=UPI003330D124
MSETTAGGLLLCRAEPTAVRPAAAHILRERLLLAPAGEWTSLVPEGAPWAGAEESVDEVLAGWTSALAIGANWPVLGLWWESGESGFALASGPRRPVSYGWAADGTPLGDPDTMRTLTARLGLDPVLDLEELERLTRPDEAADGGTRLLGLIALLARAGLALPAGLSPGEPADRLRQAARVAPGAGAVEWSGWRDAVRAELDEVEGGPLGPWLRGPRARCAGAAQVAAGAPLMLWAARRRSPGWLAAGALLVTHGALGLAYDRARDHGRAERDRARA